MRKVQEYENEVNGDCGFNRFDAEGVATPLLAEERKRMVMD